MRNALRHGAVMLIRIYRNAFSIFFGPCCRFSPSCSTYAALSIQRFGVLGGGRLALRRLIKCHPFHSGGYDPVPEGLTIPGKSKS